MNPAAALERLTVCLEKLPGVGRRSAERMALKLVRGRDGLLRELVQALNEVAARVCCCSRCGSVTTVDADPCGLCTSPRRDERLLCVVEDPGDIVLIERSGGYHGRYHALMGRLSPMQGEGRRDIRVESLLSRIKAEGFQEIILATNTDAEGEATAGFLAEVLGSLSVRVTRPALGLPAGSGIRYSDPVTLTRAFSARREA